MTSTSSNSPRVPLRTCVGCGEQAPASTLVRLVLADASNGADAARAMDVVVDAAGGSFGRGAHVHGQPACLAKAERGLSRNFKRAMRAPQGALAEAIVAALARRAESFVGSAHRLRRIEVGADAVKSRLSDPELSPPALVVVACDAGSVGNTHEVMAAIAAGRAVAWSNRAHLGALLGRNEVAIFAMTDDRLASAFADAIRTMSLLSSVTGPVPVTVTAEKAASPPSAPSARAHLTEPESQQWKGEACKSPEVR